MAPRRVQTSRDPARRRRILDAAKRLFTEQGFKGTNLDRVAAEAGCAKGALYLEFSSKEELLREVASETFAAISKRWADEVYSIESPLERLVETLRFAYRQMAAEPMFLRLMREDPELRALVGQDEAATVRAAEAQLAMLHGWVDEGIARGEIRADVDRDAVPIVLGVLRFAPQHLALVNRLGTFSGERVLEAIVDVWRAGLAAPGAGNAKSGTVRRKGRAR